jgi:hypothetical protein
MFVARMERSGIREDKWPFLCLFPDSAALHPGYRAVYDEKPDYLRGIVLVQQRRSQ